MMIDKEKLRQTIGDLAYKVTQEAATEPAFTGEYDHFLKKESMLMLWMDRFCFLQMTSTSQVVVGRHLLSRLIIVR